MTKLNASEEARQAINFFTYQSRIELAALTSLATVIMPLEIGCFHPDVYPEHTGFQCKKSYTQMAQPLQAPLNGEPQKTCFWVP